MTSLSTRAQLAWHVLRGRPLCYRIDFVGPVEWRLRPGSRIDSCAFNPSRNATVRYGGMAE